jgi:fucose permease
MSEDMAAHVHTVAIAFSGLVLGPIYPCTMTVATRLLDRRVQTASLSFISAMGSTGGAVAPFVTGLLAQAVGTFVLHPICIFCFVTMMACWLCLPKPVKRRE